MTDHDQLFKKLLKTFFAAFLDLVVPEQAKQLVLEDVKFLDKETFASVHESDRALADLVAEVRTRTGGPRLVLAHLEVEGAYRRAMPERLGYYYKHLRLNHRLPVLPVVLYLKGGPGGVTHGEVIDRVLGFEVNRFRYVSFGLSGSRAEDYLARPEPLAWGLAALMSTDSWDRVEHKLRCMQALASVELTEREGLLLSDLVQTYIELNAEESRRYDERVAAERKEKEVGTMALTYYGKVEAKTREETRLEVTRRLVLREMKRRFGSLPPTLEERLATSEDTEALERLLDATSLAEVEHF